MPNLRMQKIDSLIHKKISEIINKHSQEKIGFVSVNFVNTTKDLNNTRVFVSFDKKNEKKLFENLNSIKGLIQKDFGNSINLRKTPKIEFILDKDKQEIERVEKILEKISKKNEN